MPRTNSLLATRHSLLACPERSRWATSIHLFFLSLLLCLLTSLLPQSASAQVATGTPPWGSFGGGPFDVVNLGSLNSHFDINVRAKAGRGMPFLYDITYDTSVWYPGSVNGNQTWQHVAGYGWNFPIAATGSVTNQVVTTQQVPCSPPNNMTLITHIVYAFYVYQDPAGGTHPFNAPFNWYSDDSCSIASPGGSTTTAQDGSGYVLTLANWSGNQTVTGPDGVVYLSPSAASQVTDSNGNYINTDNNGNFTDTLGTTALSMSGTFPTKTLQYTAPNGSAAKWTVNYTSYNIKTNFGCSGIAEYTASNVELITSIVLADNSSYTFTYEDTKGNTGYKTGRLASVTLPTGGSISYAYPFTNSGTTNGINCADGSAPASAGGSPSLTRTVSPGGTWNYYRTQVSGNHWQTKVTTPPDPTVGDDTVIDFQQDATTGYGATHNFFETQRKAYQGSSGSGTLLSTTITCWNTASPTPANCPTTSVSTTISRQTIFSYLPDTSGEASETDIQWTQYSAPSLPNEIDSYDYGTGGTPGSILRKVINTYTTNTPIHLATTTIRDRYNAIASTAYNYDETTPTATSGITQHTSVSGSRGNLTSINYPVSGLTSHFTYYDTGVLNTSQDVNGATTTYNYNSTNNAYCNGAFPTSISEPLSLSRSMTWNCAGGVQLTAIDENGKTSTSAFANDKYFWRPDSVTDQSGATTNFCYAALSAGVCPSTPAPNQVETYLNFNSGGSTADSLTTLDSLGRPSLQQTRQSPSSTNFDSVLQWYDANGRIAHVTVPYIGTAGQNCCGAPASTNTYDALNRPLTLTDSGNGTLTYTYNLNDILIAVGPNPTGENTKKRQLEYDALGRLTSVCEVTAGTTAWPGASCNQNSAQTGYLTKYTYDALGNLTSVTQNAQSTTNQQTRSYSYDAMSRLTSETNPESGTKTYVYDTDSTMCGNGAYTSYGDLLKTTDANGNCVMRYYDQLHRVTDVGNSIQSASNPCKRFRYDNSSGYPGSTKPSGLVNTLGRLIEAATDTCGSTDTIITDEWFSYTARGETSDVYESTPHSGTYYHVSQTYWQNGAPNVLSGNIGLPASITYAVDGEGRSSATSVSSGQNPLSSTTYNMFSSPYQLTVAFGSGDSDVFTYDPNTMRMNKYQFKVGAQTVTGTLSWNANGSLGSLNISDPFSTANTQNCAYAADDLARISQVNCGTVWGQNFTYDPFGNITKNKITGSGATSFTPTYASSPVTNRVTSVGGVTATYDANGNSLNDTFRTFTWNAYNNPVTIGTVSLTYDALDRMVEQSVSGTNSQIVYGVAGAKLALMNGASLTKAFVPLTGGATAVYNASGLAYYRHADHLGSSRFASTPTQTLYSDTAYSPFGEPYASSGALDNSFTGENQDTSAGLYDFLLREHDPNQGRWTKTDPAGLAAVDPTNPQSWNRYAYVQNDPMIWTDPLGLCGGTGQYPDLPCPSSGDTSVTVTADGSCPPGLGPHPIAIPGGMMIICSGFSDTSSVVELEILQQMQCANGGCNGNTGGNNQQQSTTPKPDPCASTAAEEEAAGQQAAESASIAKQGMPSVDWAGTFAIGNIIKGGLYGGIKASAVAEAAVIGSAAKITWYMGKAAALQTYYSGKATFYELNRIAMGCPDTLMPDFSSPQ